MSFMKLDRYMLGVDRPFYHPSVLNLNLEEILKISIATDVGKSTCVYIFSAFLATIIKLQDTAV